MRIKVYDPGAARLAEIVGEEYTGEYGTVVDTNPDTGALIVHWDNTNTTAPWIDEYEVVNDDQD